MGLISIFPIVNTAIEVISIVFVTFVFFDLINVDRNQSLSTISEKFEKFKRYDVFKSSLIFLVLSLYFGLFSKVAVFLEFPQSIFMVFSMISSIFLLLFAFKLYRLLHLYVSKEDIKAEIHKEEAHISEPIVKKRHRAVKKP